MIKIELSKEYILLFNTLTDTAQALARLRTELMLAQQQAEELFLEEPVETVPSMIKPS